jgi:hypothetical protein
LLLALLPGRTLREDFDSSSDDFLGLADWEDFDAALDDWEDFDAALDDWEDFDAALDDWEDFDSASDEFAEPAGFREASALEVRDFFGGGGERGGERLRRRAALALAPLVDATLDGEA